MVTTSRGRASPGGLKSRNEMTEYTAVVAPIPRPRVPIVRTVNPGARRSRLKAKAISRNMIRSVTGVDGLGSGEVNLASPFFDHGRRPGVQQNLSHSSPLGNERPFVFLGLPTGEYSFRAAGDATSVTFHVPSRRVAFQIPPTVLACK